MVKFVRWNILFKNQISPCQQVFYYKIMNEWTLLLNKKFEVTYPSHINCCLGWCFQLQKVNLICNSSFRVNQFFASTAMTQKTVWAECHLVYCLFAYRHIVYSHRSFKGHLDNLQKCFQYSRCVCVWVCKCMCVFACVSEWVCFKYMCWWYEWVCFKCMCVYVCVFMCLSVYVCIKVWQTNFIIDWLNYISEKVGG